MPILEDRVIYHVGTSSLAITLPPNWLRYYGLVAGDVLEITGNEVLTLRPKKRVPSRKDISAVPPKKILTTKKVKR